MDAERYARIRQWFDTLRDLDITERAARLTEEPDPDVRARVEALLGQDTVGAASVPKSVRGLLGAIAEEAPKPGDAIGAWTLVRVLGQGGMGTVFEARRSDGHFDQTAALKVLKGLPSAIALTFLARERQILASLSHPNIARLLDGGATPSGHPYFVMAMQDGVPIDHYVASRQLSAADIVRLLLPVCAAIGYAHARLVIHCDLKPANVLVDGHGQPCVLDFGIARSMSDSGQAAIGPSTRSTRAYTPGFASPELEAGGTIGAATDVFSLGRMLGVLIGETALARHPDLQAIVTHATEPDPRSRYQSAADFESDLQHWLGHRPIRARKAAWPYRTRLWFRRHWAAALIGALIVAITAGFTLNTIHERDRALLAEQVAKAERDRALAAEARSRQISDFVVSMLDGANPEAGTGEVPLSTLVKEALIRVDTELNGQPDVQAELYGTLGRVERVLGNDEAAVAALDKAIALARSLNRPEILAAQLTEMARLRLAAFDGATAEAPAREAVAIYQTLPDVDLDTRMQATLQLGTILGNARKPESTMLLEQAVATLRREAPESQVYIDALDSLADNRINFDRTADAEVLLRESLAIQTKLGRGHAEASIDTRERLGSVLSNLNQPDEAEALLREALALRRQLLGNDNEHIAWRLTELARVLDNHGRSLEALPLYAEAVAIAASKIGVDSPSYAVMLNGQALSLWRAGDWQRSAALIQQALTVAEKRWGARDSGTARLKSNAARLFFDFGQYAKAEQMALAAEGIWSELLPPTHADVTDNRATLARVACVVGNVSQAQDWLHQIRSAVPDPAPNLERVLKRTEACIAEHAGELDASLSLLLAAEAIDQERFKPGHPQIWLGKLDRALLLARRQQPGDRDAARQLAAEILKNVDAKLLPEAPQRAILKRLLNG